MKFNKKKNKFFISPKIFRYIKIKLESFVQIDLFFFFFYNKYDDLDMTLTFSANDMELMFKSQQQIMKFSFCFYFVN